jgi:hypothetical protein
MLRYEASIRELFCRLCTADRSFVPQDDREIGYVVVRRNMTGKASPHVLRHAQDDSPAR